MSVVTMRSAFVTTDGQLDEFTVNVSVVPTTGDNDRPYRLSIAPDQLYLNVRWTAQGVIVWQLDPTLPAGALSIEFDQPAVTFDQVPAGLSPMVMPNRQTVVMPWSNVDPSLPGMRPFGVSYNYMLHVRVKVASDPDTYIPISHDPTVHNETPNP